MEKRKITLILILLFIIFTTSLYQAPRAKAFIESHVDPENDVVRIDSYDQKKIVSTQPQVDIINIALNVGLNNQYTNVSFLGNITGYNMECNIYFFENYNPNNLIFEYGVHYSNFTGTGFKVILVKYILNGDQYDFEYWNNISNNWTPDNTSADSIGSFSDYTIEATIPQLAFTINENTTWFVLSSYYDGNYFYLDAAPDSFSPIRENNGFDYVYIYIVVAIIIVVIFICYFYRRKKIK